MSDDVRVDGWYVGRCSDKEIYVPLEGSVNEIRISGSHCRADARVPVLPIEFGPAQLVLGFKSWLDFSWVQICHGDGFLWL